MPAVVGVMVQPQQFGAGLILCHGGQGSSYTNKVSASCTVVKAAKSNAKVSKACSCDEFPE